MPVETLKSYYGGRSKALETGVCISTNLDFTAHMSLTDSFFGLHCPHYISSQLHEAKPNLPGMAGEG